MDDYLRALLRQERSEVAGLESGLDGLGDARSGQVEHGEAEEAVLRSKDREINRLAGLVAELQDKLMTMEMEQHAKLQKWRKRAEAAINELRLAQRGLTSGCGCPVGTCLKPRAGQACWIEWAGLNVFRQAASQKIDEMVRAANHPRRLRESPGALPSPDGEAPKPL